MAAEPDLLHRLKKFFTATESLPAVIKDHELKSETFSHALGRACRTYCRGWYLGIGVWLMIMIGWFYGIGSSVVCLVLLAILGIGAVFINWIAEDKMRALQLILVLILLPFASQISKRLMNDRDRPQYPSHPTVHNQAAQNTGSGRPSAPKTDSVFQRTEVQQRSIQALAYWRTGVADLHLLRFSTPTGDEPASKYLERMFQNLQDRVDRAKSTSTVNVDRDLFTMVQKHLAVDEHALQLKRKIDDLMKRENISADGDTIGDRLTEWQNIVATIQANPAMIDKLPDEARQVFGDAVELDEKRNDQFREIEIMQAVLQERYPGTKFPLPEIARYVRGVGKSDGLPMANAYVDGFLEGVGAVLNAALSGFNQVTETMTTPVSPVKRIRAKRK